MEIYLLIFNKNTYFCILNFFFFNMKNEKPKTDILVDVIINSIQEKKGKNIASLNLQKIQNAISDYYIICHGTSNTQVEAIAESVLEEVKKNTGEIPKSKEGFQNSEWILIDFFDVVVHIFQEQTRNFYQIEKLWADSEIKYFENEN